MVKHVLIIGGYGNFGSYIALHLAHHENIELIIAGRSKAKAEAFVGTLQAHNPPLIAELDITRNLSQTLEQFKPAVVIHTSGPFQGQDSFVARACVEHNCHYIDLADGREFVTNIAALNDAAKAKDLTVVSGASSVPCLSSCIIDKYESEFADLQSIDYAISTAQMTNRGEATTAAILSYAGKPFSTLFNGQKANVYGWQNLHTHKFKDVGKRYLGNCDIPDLALFPEHYPSLKTIRFYAGLELSILHIGLWGLTWLVRLGLIKNLKNVSSFLLKASFLFDRFGSDTSAFYIRMKGIDNEGEPKEVRFDLTARSGDGPYIPCTPAILLTRKLVEGASLKKGAIPCVGVLTLDEYLEALKPLDITWSVQS